jgi:hypothetical protein
MTLTRSNPRAKQRWALLAILTVALSLLAAGAVFALVTDGGSCDVRVDDKLGFEECDLTPGGANVEYIGDSNVTFGSSGTGTFNPFVRLQASPTESGYNTDGTLQFNSKSGNWTHAIKVSEIPTVPCATTALPGRICWELFVDINEGNSTKHVSLNEMEIYYSSSAHVTGYPFTTPNPAGTVTTKEYDFSGSILINDVNQGSGRGDLRYLVPLNGTSPIALPANCDYLNAACSTYFVLYSQWGAGAGTTYASDGGFEEWKVKVYPVPPKLKLVKSVINDNGGAAVANDWTLTATGTSLGFSDSGGSGVFHAVTPGVQYTLSESAVANYTAGTTWSCVGGTFVSPDKITLAAAQQATCTITNNDIPPQLHLRKVVINNNGRTATVADFTLTADGTGSNDLSGTSPVDSGTGLLADTWALSETSPAGYTPSAWVCVGGTQSGSNITVGIGGSATCTITNDDTPQNSGVTTAPWIYPNDEATVSAAAGQTDIDGEVVFKLYGATGGADPKTALENCEADGATGLLYTETVPLPGAAATSKTVSTSNPGTTGTPLSIKIDSSQRVYWSVAYGGDTNHVASASECVEYIDVTLQDDTTP